MSVLVPAPFLLPVLAAGLAMMLGRHPRVQRVITVAVLGSLVAVSAALLVQVDRQGTQVVDPGGWPAPFGVTLAVDMLSALMLVVSSIVLLSVLVFTLGQGRRDAVSAVFHPAYMTLAAGVGLAFVTGDMFNLFVAFEITLMSSYVLVTFRGSRDQVRFGMTYVVINVVASLLFLTAIALLYAATGTVNMADLTLAVARLGDGTRTAFALLFLLVFGVKAAMFPLFFWLPDSYPTAPTPVTAVFAGLLTKLGVYAILRTQTLVFGDDVSSVILLAIAGTTMIVGVLGAIAQDDMKRILSFHIISQIGYMIMGLGLLTVSGLAASVFFVVHQIPVKTALFLTGGMIESTTGTSALSRLGGLMRRAPLVATFFGLTACSLAGFPPFSGFVGKYGLVSAGVSEGAWLIVGVSLLGSLLTLFSMTKIWAGVFWGEPDTETDRRRLSGISARYPPTMIVGCAAVVVLTLAVALFAGQIWNWSEQAARELRDPDAYVEAVLGGRLAGGSP